mgnify:CR=1 FL=1
MSLVCNAAVVAYEDDDGQRGTRRSPKLPASRSKRDDDAPWPSRVRCRCRRAGSVSIGSRGAAHIGGLMRSSSVLETIALGGNPIGDAGLIAIE